MIQIEESRKIILFTKIKTIHYSYAIKIMQNKFLAHIFFNILLPASLNFP